jgi:hypothetical protein
VQGERDKRTGSCRADRPGPNLRRGGYARDQEEVAGGREEP